jgi:copper chaperone CopZ
MSASGERTYIVEGMTCGHCERSVREEVEELPGVESARADRTTGRLIVRGDFDDAALREAVEAAGYELAATAGAGHEEPSGDSS